MDPSTRPFALAPSLAVAALVVLGAVLSAGCGGYEEEPVDDLEVTAELETDAVKVDAPQQAAPVYRCTEEELIEALERGKPATVKACLDSGTHPDAVNEKGRRALYLAAWNGDAESAAALLEAGAWVDQIGFDRGTTPLFAAAIQGHDKVVDLLLSYGADANYETGVQSTLLAACRMGHTRAAMSLISAGADVNYRGDMGETPLIHAVAWNDRELVERLIASGADVESQGSWALSLVAGKRSRQEMYDLLIAAGAKEN